MNIRHLINYSFNDATKSLVMGTSPESLARARERAYMKSLASHFSDSFDEADIRVFSAFGRGNAEDFGTEQLFYDIQICRVARAQTADRKKDDFSYIKQSLWQIETDFSRELTASIYAFNRLIVGNAEHKLMVGAQLSTGQKTYLKSLKPLADSCSGNVYLALVPHPDSWDEDDQTIDVWQFDTGDWQSLS